MNGVVCLGAATLDLIAVIEEPIGPDQRVQALDSSLAGGGVAATAAVALARAGVDVSLVATIGDDDASRLIEAGLEREGVGIRSVRSAPGTSPMSPVLIDRATGQRAIAAYYPPGHAVRIDDAVIAAAADATWLHADQRGWPAVMQLREAGVSTPVSLDHGNPTPGLDLRQVTLYAPTESRLRERFPGLAIQDAIRAAMDEGPRIVVVTRGAAGSMAGYRKADGDEASIVEAGAYRVDIVSTLGAGDVFHGSLLASLIHGLSVPNALAHANAAAALSCRALDGRSAIPTWAELADFMDAQTRHGDHPGDHWSRLTT